LLIYTKGNDAVMSETTKIRYKITATVSKHGGAPTTWIHFSEKKLTQTQCVKMLSTRTQVGKFVSVKVTLSDFVCVKILNEEH
ncbi:DUF1187 family protein, partial [Klebsiella aerogenes]|uniref:DUF1187 family protein n=2 Tax=Klebsiella aerogenes TaxID=548 RepID=UPI001EF81D60